MKRSAIKWAGAGGALAMLLLAGCSAGGGGTGTDASAGFVESDFYGEGAGEIELLKWNIVDGEPSSLNPIYSANVPARAVLANICDQLLVQNDQYETLPGLATPTQVDPTTLQLDLVDNATFWDGTPVTSADVVYSFEQNMRPDGQNASFFTNVAGVEATGEHQVLVHFSQPDQLFAKELASSVGTVWSKAYAEAAGDSYGTAEGGVMCSGPFELDAWNQGTSIILKKNENYWNPDFMPKVDEVRLSFVIDTSAVAQGILAGEFDGAWSVRPAGIDAIRNDSSGQLVVGSSIAQWMFSFANPDGVTADPKLRQAIFGSIDRQAMVDAVLKGFGEPAYTIIAPNYWDEEGTPIYEEAYPQYEESNSLSVDDAKKLVEESDYNGETLKFAYLAGDESWRTTAELFQQQLAQIGVTLELLPMEGIAFMTATYTPEAREDFDLIALNSFGTSRDPLEFLNFFVGAGQPYNYTDFEAPEVTAGLVEAMGTFDSAERAEILVRLQEKWEAARPMTVIHMPQNLTWVRDGIGGVTTSAAYLNLPSLALIGADE